jgi:hypothetical protein
MTPSKQIPLAGDHLPAGKQTRAAFPPVAALVAPLYPQSVQYSAAEVSYRLPCRIVIRGARIAIRLRSVSLHVEGVSSRFFVLRCVAHTGNRIGEFLSWVTNLLSRTTK